MFGLGLLFALATTMAASDTVSRGTVERELTTLVTTVSIVNPATRDTMRIVGFMADSGQRPALLAPFLRSEGRIVWYLAAHTPGGSARLVPKGADAAAVRDSIVRALMTSPAFTERVLGMLSKFWQSDGRVISGYAGSLPPLDVTMAQLSRVGARFFYPERASTVGDTIWTHICADINGLADLPEPVDPLVEAFVFAAINRVVLQPQSPLMQAFNDAMKRTKAISASKDPATRVLRAQGALWAQLEQSAALSSTLQHAYDEHEKALPLRLHLPPGPAQAR